MDMLFAQNDLESCLLQRTRLSFRLIAFRHVSFWLQQLVTSHCLAADRLISKLCRLGHFYRHNALN
jgi:hypothetical protein